MCLALYFLSSESRRGMVGVIVRFERSSDDRWKIKAHCSFVEYVRASSAALWRSCNNNESFVLVDGVR